jgi:hypothetical protein
LTAARSFGAACLTALLWLAGLGAAIPAEAHQRATGDAADVAAQVATTTPALAPRHSAPTLQRIPSERHAPPDGAGGALRLAPAAPGRRLPDARAILSRQAAAHVARPQWRRYDANAPPVRS